MKVWQKLKSALTIQIPGPTWTLLLMVASLGTITVLFTVLPTGLPEKSTLGGSTFGKNESLDLVLKMENGVELHLKATGATTMDLVQSLNRMLKNTGKNPLEELY